MKCSDLELNVLVAMEKRHRDDSGAVKTGLSEKDALKARKSAMAKVEKDSSERTKMCPDVVSSLPRGRILALPLQRSTPTSAWCLLRRNRWAFRWRSGQLHLLAP